MRADADQQDRGVQQSRQDGAASPAIGPAARRWKTCEPGGAPAEQQAQHVAEVVSRVGQQRHGVGHQAEGDLGCNECDIQGRADGKCTIVPVTGVMVVMVVVMVRHAGEIMPGNVHAANGHSSSEEWW